MFDEDEDGLLILHFSTLYYTLVRYITLQNVILQFSTIYYMSVRFITLLNVSIDYTN